MVFIVLIGAIWQFIYEQERIAPENQTAGKPQLRHTMSKLDTTGWKTYRNEEHGFEFKYPGEWSFDREGIWLTQPGTDLQEEHPLLRFEVLQLQPGQNFGELSELESIDIAQDCRRVDFSGKLAYECKPLITFAGEKDFIIQLSDLYTLFVFDSIENITSQNILTTLTFFEPKR